MTLLTRLLQKLRAFVPHRREAEGGGEKPASSAPAPFADVPIFDLVRDMEQMAKIGFWRLDVTTGSCYWSPEVFAIHGLAPCHHVDLDKALDHYPKGKDRERIAAAVEGALTRGEAYDLELDFIAADGVRKRVRAMGKPSWHGGEIDTLIGVFQDVSHSHRMEQRLRDLAHSDPLTRLPNRRHLENHFDDGGYWSAAIRKTPFACAIIDLDHFKSVNDTFGHECGDAVLKAVSERLSADWLNGNFAARLGGDEFVLLIVDEDCLADLPDTARRLLADLSRDLAIEEGSLKMSSTIGIASFDCGGQPLRDVLRCADTALYAAKGAGRGTARIATQDALFLGVDCRKQRGLQVA